ncbi:MAG: GNAT family N-acetyltransferase [Desulfosarcina sp.]|nr:GNAT family N-acetyltransferase [Desulfosarcina sp.]MBC2741891.1 GNAT family N-acetyltransferase [Desulfosarcina sp.]MBC2764804.1 GNAT family N-acetyltransferase [Desulfosarcina sp.]
MTDLLVKLYDLPDQGAQLAALAKKDIRVRRAMASEKSLVVGWVENLFGDGWAAECDVAFARQPIACMIAVSGGRLEGFACHDSTCLNFFGPIGIDPVSRQKGIGRAVLLTTLSAMAHAGYAYAIIGGAGPMAFFEKCVETFPIPESTPGIYRPTIKEI